MLIRRHQAVCENKTQSINTFLKCLNFLYIQAYPRQTLLLQEQLLQQNYLLITLKCVKCAGDINSDKMIVRP